MSPHQFPPRGPMPGGRDILSEYGKDVSHPQAPRATSGGVEHAKPIHYHEPQGPTSLHHERPGLGGSNHGMAPRPTADRGSGCAGIGGTVHRSGSQRG